MHDKYDFNLYTPAIFMKCMHICAPKTTMKNQKVHPRATFVDEFDKCVIRRKIAEDGFKTITAERWRSVCEHVKKVEANTGRGTISVKGRFRS